MNSFFNPQKIAVTGATGALGFAFLKTILEQVAGLRVIALVRRESPGFRSQRFQALLAAYPGQFTLIEADLSRLRISPREARLLTQTDGGLWHFAARTSLDLARNGSEELTSSVNEAGTRQLLAVLRESLSPSRFYHVSTAYVAGQRRGSVLESELDLGQSFRTVYEASKLRAEAQVRRCFAEGLTGAIFRPSIVIANTPSPGVAKVVDVCAYAVTAAIRGRKPEFVFRFPGNAGLNLVHVDWVIDAMLHLAREPLATGTTYHLTSRRDTLLREIGSTIQLYRPDFTVMFEPGWPRAALNAPSRFFDRAIENLQAYFQTELRFDRTNTDRALPPALRKQELDLPELVRARLAEAGIALAPASPSGGSTGRLLPAPGTNRRITPAKPLG